MAPVARVMEYVHRCPFSHCCHEDGSSDHEDEPQHQTGYPGLSQAYRTQVITYIVERLSSNEVMQTRHAKERLQRTVSALENNVYATTQQKEYMKKMAQKLSAVYEQIQKKQSRSFYNVQPPYTCQAANCTAENTTAPVKTEAHQPVSKEINYNVDKNSEIPTVLTPSDSELTVLSNTTNKCMCGGKKSVPTDNPEFKVINSVESYSSVNNPKSDCNCSILVQKFNNLEGKT